MAGASLSVKEREKPGGNLAASYKSESYLWLRMGARELDQRYIQLPSGELIRELEPMTPCLKRFFQTFHDFGNLGCIQAFWNMYARGFPFCADHLAAEFSLNSVAGVNKAQQFTERWLQ
jgi:hypothetical protein